MTQRRFLRGNQFLREFTALFGECGKLCEQAPAGINQVKAREQNRAQRRSQKPINLALHPRVNVRDFDRGLFLAGVVFNEQAIDGDAQS